MKAKWEKIKGWADVDTKYKKVVFEGLTVGKKRREIGDDKGEKFFYLITISSWNFGIYYWSVRMCKLLSFKLSRYLNWHFFICYELFCFVSVIFNCCNTEELP